jgi:acyl carrier protein
VLTLKEFSIRPVPACEGRNANLPMSYHVVKLIEEVLCRGKQFPLGESDSLLENGLIDSLGMLELVKTLENRFQIRVADDELSPENFDSIEALTAYLRRKGVPG